MTAKNAMARMQQGFSLMEILVTMVILMIGLLGLVGLQGKAINAQMESYQRAQAIVLVQDMHSRIEANRANAAAYVTALQGTPNSGSAVVKDCSTGTRPQIDLCEWHNALLGAAVTKNVSGTPPVGAMIGARGCIYQISASPVPEYVVAVAWQGLSLTKKPDGVPCGENQYGNDAQRRVVALPISIGVTH